MQPSRRRAHHFLTVAAAATSLVASSPAHAAPSAERIAEPAAEVRDYWTAARMRAAEPVEEVDPEAGPAPGAPAPTIGGAPSWVRPADAGEAPRARKRAGVPVNGSVFAERVPDSSAPEVRMHGRVFFTIAKGPDADDYSCSGTAVNSPNRRVVWTAGHCAFELSGGGYVSNWTFVPAYDDGAAPFGEWPARRLLVTGRYRNTQDLRYDFAAAVVARSPAGSAIQDVVGARGIGFNQPRAQRYVAYGYPIEGPFFIGNRHQYRCTSPEQGGDRFFPYEPRPMAIRCDMTGGASGGGWVAPGGVLLSVTSYGYYPTDPLTLYGPYLGNAAKAVYEEASRKRKPKRARAGKGSRNGRGGRAGK